MRLPIRNQTPGEWHMLLWLLLGGLFAAGISLMLVADQLPTSRHAAADYLSFCGLCTLIASVAFSIVFIVIRGLL